MQMVGSCEQIPHEGYAENASDCSGVWITVQVQEVEKTKNSKVEGASVGEG